MKFDSTLGDLVIHVDPKTDAAIKAFTNQHGVNGWMRYVYRAINEKFSWVAEPRLDMRDLPDLLKDPTGLYLTERMDAKFDKGPCAVYLMLFAYGRVETVANRLNMRVDDFVLESLALWASIPHGQSID